MKRLLLLLSIFTIAYESAIGQNVTDTLEQVTVTKTIDRNVNFTQTGLTKIDGGAFKKGFAVFSSPDVVKTLQMLTGVASGTEMMSNLYVHGGDGSDNLFLLDGVPLYQICHLGGIFSSFNTDVIDNINFYKSGFPARYGGRTSSVVDVSTKDGDFRKYHGTVSVGLLDGRLQFEGPIVKDRTSFNLAMRRSWIDLILLPAFAISNKGETNTKSYTYAFADINARVTHKFSADSKLTGNIYWGYDDFKAKIYSENQEKFTTSKEDTRIGFNWGNILGSLSWDKKFGRNLDMKLIGFYSGSFSDIGFDMLSVYDNNSYKDRAKTSNEGRVNDYGITADFDYLPHERHRLRMGTSYIFHQYRPRYDYYSQVTVDGKLTEDIHNKNFIAASGNEFGIYAEDEMTVAKWLKLNIGLRYALYESDSKIWNSFEPRVALKFQASSNVSIKASYSEMSQFSHLVASTYIDLPTNMWLPSTELIAPMRSRQVSGGVYANLPYNLHLNVEGWWKTMHNLIEYSGEGSLVPRLDNWEENFKLGQGKSYGAEVDFGYETGKTTLNLFYTLSWNLRKFDDIYPYWYRDRNDNRHKLTLMGTHRFNDKVEIYAAWNYHSGNRMSIPTQHIENGMGAISEDLVYEEPNNIKLPDYHRLDLGLNIYLKTRRGNQSIWNISIYNVYCRINPIFATIQQEYDKEGKATKFYGVGMGVIPILPTISYTFKF